MMNKIVKSMKMKMKKIIFIMLCALTVLSSCHNDDWEFPDFDYTTVYFSYQYPVRTITLGEDNLYNTEMDNAHKCKIMATTGGAYTNKTDITVDIQVTNDLCDNLLFGDRGEPVIPMPSNYYTLSSNKIVIPKGEIVGGVEVQLTDAFFADPQAIKNTYVIPISMNQAQNVDSILRGLPKFAGANRCVSDEWSVLPKDYILYAVKYINPWHASYLRRGKDIITGKDGDTSLDKTVIRHAAYVEKDEVCKMTTQSMTQVVFSPNVKDKNGIDIPCDLILSFDNESKCTLTTESTDFIATGAGTFVKKGDKKSWGNEDRDVIYLNYKLDFSDMQYTSTDTLVVRSRDVVMETFLPVLNN
jgi:hypothetical protein